VLRRPILILLVVAFLTGLTVYQRDQQTAVMTTTTEQKPKIGYPAPAFSLTGLDKQTYQVDGPREKPVLINFWASWCGPCKLEAPDLQKLSQKYQGKVDFYAINSTSNDNLEDAMAFVESFKLTFPIPLDHKGEVTDLYQVNAFPTTYLIDRQGVIRQKIIGTIDPKELEAELAKLLVQ